MITDGKFYTYISLKSKIPKALCAELAKLQEQLSLSPRLNSCRCIGQPLPAGYGFVLINREGRVLHQMDRRLSLRENFFEELSQRELARRAVFSDSPTKLASRSPAAAPTLLPSGWHLPRWRA